MSATERMRALLDQRGVKYGGDRSVVYFEDSRGYKAMAYEAPRRYGNGVLCVHHTATPEQAVEATLGRGTCRSVWDVELTGRLRFQCSECGAVSLEITPRFCPGCGREVVE